MLGNVAERDDKIEDQNSSACNLEKKRKHSYDIQECGYRKNTNTLYSCKMMSR